LSQKLSIVSPFHAGLDIFSAAEYGGAKIHWNKGTSQEYRGDKVGEATCKSSAS